MDTRSMNRNLFSDMVHTMYCHFGYEALMKEILFIHHTYQTHTLSDPDPVPIPVPSAPAPAPAPAPVPVHVPAPVPSDHVPSVPTASLPRLHCKRSTHDTTSVVVVNKVTGSEVVEEKKEELITRVKYARSKKPDNVRCMSITNKGIPCSLSRHESSDYCLRHTRANQQIKNKKDHIDLDEDQTDIDDTLSSAPSDS